jgi:3-hydroxyisobutyrate dehydrogenase
MNVGFIGIGQMGKHMSNRILEAGYNLTVNDLKKEIAAPLIAKGAKWCDTPAEVAAATQVVFSSLPTPAIVEEVVYGENGRKEIFMRT